MSWHTLRVRLPVGQLEAAEALLEECGAVSVTLQDAGGQPILEPDPDTTPLWSQLQVEALFPDSSAVQSVLLRLHAAGLITSLDQARAGQLEDRVWERAWMDRFQPMRFGDGLWICPSHVQPDPAWPVVVRLDPGLAFGSGTHPTTAMCLEWLDGATLQNRCVIDYGTGSGVLAIAAALCGAGRVIAVDHDPQALAACADNATRNGVADRLEIVAPGDLPAITADVLVANILAQPLIDLAPRFAALLKPGGVCVLSGILCAQAAAVSAAYRPWFPEIRTRQSENWLCLDGKRR